MARDQQCDLREALGTYFSAGGGGGHVRPEIEASWKRSISAELQPDRFEVPYEPESSDAERVGRAAKPVLERLVQDFASTSMGLVLTDDQGRIVERFVADRSLRSRLDGILLAPGFRYAEQQVGTNAIGTALEQGGPAFVVGGEHFADALTGMACAAAPVVDPTTGSVVGVVDLTCSVRQSQSLMVAVVKQAARDIERELVGDPVADRVLLERFSRARRGARGPLVGINAQVMYQNAAAVKLLRQADRSLLWNVVAAGLFEKPGSPIELSITPGSTSVVVSEPVFDGRDLAGALIRFPVVPQVGRDGSVTKTGRGPAYGWYGLTPTEDSVAELVADGLTNREVAAQLYLSSHTVGFHLRQIFRKLDINSRVELTRLFVERSGDSPASTSD
jgi:transcriptional regulator of acetoin/glycerol metabolism/DNA-binding CsgD family transcriptional regulator